MLIISLVPEISTQGFITKTMGSRSKSRTIIPKRYRNLGGINPRLAYPIPRPYRTRNLLTWLDIAKEAERL